MTLSATLAILEEGNSFVNLFCCIIVTLCDVFTIFFLLFKKGTKGSQDDFLSIMNYRLFLIWVYLISV